MEFCIRLKAPLFTRVNYEEFLQICTLSTEGSPRDTKVLVSIGDRNQLNDVNFEFTNGIPIVFNSVGVSVFEEVILNTCGNIKGTFKKPGEYVFTVALLDQVTNELLDEEIAVFKVSPSGHKHHGL